MLTRRRTVFYGIAAVLFLAADLGGVHVLFARHWDLRTAAADPSVFKVAPQAFSPYRGLVPDENPRMKAGHELIAPTKNILAAEHFGFLGFDPCLPFNFLPMNWTRGIDELMQVRFPFFREADSGELMPPAEYLTYTRVVGCADTKLRLTNRVSAAGSHEEALALVKELPDFGIAHVVEAGPGEVLSEPALSQEAGKAYRMPDGSYGIEQALGRVHVTDFSYNRLRADVEVRDPGVWLYYADANHRGWKAFLDGQEVPVAAADVGFKAVRLPSGEHTVEFRFWNGWQSAASAAVALLALGYSVILIFFMVQTVRRGFLNDPA